jgi:hypothetical protein
VFELSTSICIDAPVAEVWRWLADLEAITLWSSTVLRASCPGERTGVGAERICDLRGGVVLRERWLEWDEGRSFTYEGRGLPLVAVATNRWVLTPADDRTLLTSTATLGLKGRVAGRALEPVFGLLARRTAARSFLPFKFLVEHDRPFDGARDALGHALSSC